MGHPGSPQIQKITSRGGAVIAQVTTTTAGSNTGDNVWYTGDVTIADQAVACADPDPAHRHATDLGRGLQRGGAADRVHVVRAVGLLSGVISYSGGDIVINRVPLQDPSHRPVGLASHGAAGSDALGVDFNHGQPHLGDARTPWPSSSTATTAAITSRRDRAP